MQQRSMLEPISMFGFSLFVHLLLHGLEGLAFRSPMAWKAMEFLTPVLGGIHPFEIGNSDVRETVYGLVNLASNMIFAILVLNNVDRIAKSISKALSPHAAFWICGWSHMVAAIIAGGNQNLFLVGSVSALSISVVSASELCANRKDSLVMARWVLAQSTVATAIPVCQGYFLVAAVAILPILPAIFIIQTSGGDQIASQVKQVSAFNGGNGKGSKSNELNQNIANTQKDDCQVDSKEEMV